MRTIKQVARWLPAFVLMSTIFAASSIPSTRMPAFGSWDGVVKKGGHFLGYGLLALAYWFGLGWKRKYAWLAFILSMLHAIADEFHQGFVPGRQPSLVDALIFDNGGAGLALLCGILGKKNIKGDSLLPVE